MNYPRLHQDEVSTEAPAPIPFPRRSETDVPDSIRMAEDALRQAESKMRELADLMGPIPFHTDDDDDGPRAA